MIIKYLSDFTEILSTFNLIVTYFPEEVLEMLRATNALLFLANSYCLTIHLKNDLNTYFRLTLSNYTKSL